MIVEVKTGTPLPDLGEGDRLKVADWRAIQEENPGLTGTIADGLKLTPADFRRAIEAGRVMARYEDGKLILELDR